MAEPTMNSSSTLSFPATASQPTLNVFWTTSTTNYAGWVLGANACETTVLLSCTRPSLCGPIQVATITQGTGRFAGVVATSVPGTQALISVSCTTSSPRVICYESVAYTVLDVTSVGSTVATYAPSDFTPFPVPITAGAAALTSATGSCTTATNPSALATTPTPSTTSALKSSAPPAQVGETTMTAPAKSGLSKGSKIAIGVGVSVGLLAVISAVVAAAWWRRRKARAAAVPKERAKSIDSSADDAEKPRLGEGIAELPEEYLCEMEVDDRAHEVEGQSNQRHEMFALTEMGSGSTHELHCELEGDSGFN